MKTKLFLKIYILLNLPFLVNAQNHCEYVNIGCEEHNNSVIVDQTFTIDDPVIVHAILSPAIQTSEITFDGNYLWVGSGLDSMMFKISREDGEIKKALKTIINRPYGVAYDGDYLWVADNETQTIHKVDPSNGNSVLIFDAPYQGDMAYATGLAFDGEHLWHADSEADSIYTLSLEGEILSSRGIDLDIPAALTFAYQHLWASDNHVHLLYQIDTTTFDFLDTIRSPLSFPNGLAFDGQYLWVAENSASGGTDSLFQLDIGLPPLSTKIVTDPSIVEIFPNPTSNAFQIKLKADNNSHISKIAITTLDGKVIHQANIDDQNLNNHEISLADQSPGIYFCQIIIDDKVLVKKIVKQ